MNQITDNTPNNNQPDSGDTLSTLINRVRILAHPPIFHDNDEQTRRASILYTFLLGTLLFSLIVSVLVLFTSSNPLLVAALLFFVEAIMVTGMILIRRGRIDFTGRMITGIFWAFIAVVALLYGNIINPTMPTFITIVFIAGLTVNSRTGIYATILTLIYSLIYLGLQSQDMLPTLIEVQPENFVLLIGFNIAMAAFLMLIANRTTNQALNQLSDAREELIERNEELTGIQTYLQETVTERTNQLEKRNKYLQAASEVAKQTLTTLNVQEMLDNIANLISEQFGFYHVGIFLLDDPKEWAILRAVSSLGGQKMLARNHRLEVGKQGIVGFVTSIGQARISQDTEMDRIHSITVELPDTRSEMALPLKVRGKIIGALDIQDSTQNAFTDEDIPVLQTVADQIALAVENIRLFQQSQEAIEEIQRAYGEYSQQAWFETYQKSLLHSYRYIGGSVETISENEQIRLIGNKVSVPISIRGQNIGAIEIAKGEGPENWSEEELKLLNALSEQLGVALDSARLYNETQLRASTEHVISQISSELWETLEINSILKTAAEKLRTALAVPELTVRLATPTSDELQTESENGNISQPELFEAPEEEIGN